MGQLAVMITALVEIVRKVLQGVIHPAHVPFERKAEAADMDIVGDALFYGRILRHQIAARALGQLAVELLEKIRALEIDVAAVNIRAPLGTAEIGVLHRRYSVNAQRIDMELVDPVKSAGDQERAHLGLAVIKGVCAPDRELRSQRIGRLVQRRAVKATEREVVLRKMRRYPVEDDADPALVEAIDQISQVIGSAVTRGGGKIARDLIAPGRVEGILTDSHQLDMGVAHMGNILRELIAQLTVIQKAVGIVLVLIGFLPRSEVYLIDRHRLFDHLCIIDPLHISGVVPFVSAQRTDHRSVLGSEPAAKSVGIAFEMLFTVGPDDHITVSVAVFDRRDKDFPDTVHGAFHGIFGLPLRRVADHADALRVGRPYGKVRAFFSVFKSGMRSHLFIDLIARSLMEEVAVCVIENPHIPSLCQNDRSIRRLSNRQILLFYGRTR